MLKQPYLSLKLNDVDRIRYFNNEDYKKYIYPSLVKYYSSYTIKEGNLKTILEYHYKYIYYNYENAGEKSFIYSPTVRMDGGRKLDYFEKYIKFKNKYLA